MKTFLSLLLIGCVAILSGCKSSASQAAGDLFAKKTVIVDQASQTNYVTVTNTVYTTNVFDVTNSAGQVSTTATIVAQPTITTNMIVLPAITHNEYSPGIAVSGIEAAASINPIAGAGATILATLFGVVMTVINHRNQAKAQATIAGHADTINSLSGMVATGKDAVSTLVNNIETIRTAASAIPGYAAVDAKIMPGIQAVQELMGVTPLIEPEVNNLPATNIASASSPTIKVT